MFPNSSTQTFDAIKLKYPEKFADQETIFKNLYRGMRIFISTGCGEPQYLVNSMIQYVEKHPKALFDSEVFQVWTLGVAPYTQSKFKRNFRHNSFFISTNSREAVNLGMADYTPIFLSNLPDLIRKKVIPIDLALIQTSFPDSHGYFSLGVSVDIVKAAVENASMVITQVNRYMPRTHGDGFVHINDIDYIIAHDEPLLQFQAEPDDEVINKIGKYVARLVKDGDTIQVGYGSTPDAILANLKNKKHLGVHTELISDGIVSLMKKGVIDNSQKSIDHGKAVVSFCMGNPDTYAFIHDNPAIAFRTIDYTNNPLIIAGNDNMVAINSALEIDLTGQASAESIGKQFFSGIGGQADFMRGAVLAKNGRTILTLQSTAQNETVSRIVPLLPEGAGVTLNRGDIHYVVTEYGIAYLHGKNIRERAIELISIAHPKFRVELLKSAKKLNFIYQDQAFIPGKRGEYREYLEKYCTTKKNFELFFRPVKFNDEPKIKDFFYSLSDTSLYRRFISARKDIPFEKRQEFVVVDYSREMLIVATIGENENEKIVGLGQYGIDEMTHTAEIAFVVRDSFQNKGIGREMLKYLTLLAKKQGLLGFSAEVLLENKPMLHLFETMGFYMEKRIGGGVYELKMLF